ncbi:MAG: cellulase family glycosylhydrolase [Actinobacteria bacterium]|nr:cellulase family glycosylhydrolase [Actinomycetota bacterium]
MQPTPSPARRRIARLVALFVAVVLVGAVASVMPAKRAHAAVMATSGGPGDKFGFATGADILWNRTPAQQAAELDTIANAGVKWVRFDISWDTVQPYGPASWNWSQPDAVVAAAQARGLHVLGVLTYTPQWARLARCSTDRACPPADDNQFAAFARAAAVHYGANVNAWEIWNEPNWDPFWRSPNAADYVALLKPTYTAIKSVSPGTTVVTGGLAPYGDLNRTAIDPLVALSNPVNFLTAMYAAGAKGYFDAVGHHPYAYPYAPTDCCVAWNAVLQTQTLHMIMAANGDGNKLVWGTEAGAPTAGQNAVTEAQQADWVSQYVQLWNSWSFTGPLMFFTVRDLGTSADNTDHFGFTRTDLSPKPAYTALIQALAAIGGMGPIAGDSGVSPFLKVGTPSQAVAVRSQGGYYVMSSTGRVEAFGGAPYYGAPSFPPGLAKDLAVMPDGAGYVVLDAWGGVHKFGSAVSLPVPATYWPGWDIARHVVITADGRGIAVLDGWGGVHWAGTAAGTNLQAGWWRGWDIARSMALTPDGRGIYVLDAWGGIHTAGTATYKGGPFWYGWDIARDIVVTPSGNGYAVLDGFGGVHPVGDAPTQLTPGFTVGDTWRSLALKTS